jgi:hypothetical protein
MLDNNDTHSMSTDIENPCIRCKTKLTEWNEKLNKPYSKCPDCRQLDLAYGRKIRARYRQEGRCYCGRQVAQGTICQDCRDDRTKYNHR